MNARHALDGNASALREYHAQQDTNDRMSGTEAEREEFIEDWLAAKMRKLGTEYMTEALAEMGNVSTIALFAAFREDAQFAGGMLQLVVRNYWLPSAKKACEEHDFTPERCF